MRRRPRSHRPKFLPPPGQARREGHRRYNRTRRDPDAQAIYDSARWKRVRALKIDADPLCEVCEREGRTTLAAQVHHVVKVRDEPGRAYDMANLMSVCRSCHARIEDRDGSGG